MVIKNYQKFIANNWPFKLWISTLPLATTAFVLSQFYKSVGEPSLDIFSIGLNIIIVLLVAAISYLFWLMQVPFAIFPIYYRAMIRNGGPFKEGDMVSIISKQYFGRVCRVYSTWQGISVRVEIGTKEMETYKDIFFGYELIKSDLTSDS